MNEIFQLFPEKRFVDGVVENYAFNDDDALRLIDILIGENKYIVLGVEVFDENLEFTYNTFRTPIRTPTGRTS